MSRRYPSDSIFEQPIPIADLTGLVRLLRYFGATVEVDGNPTGTPESASELRMRVPSKTAAQSLATTNVEGWLQTAHLLVRSTPNSIGALWDTMTDRGFDTPQPPNAQLVAVLIGASQR